MTERKIVCDACCVCAYPNRACDYGDAYVAYTGIDSRYLKFHSQFRPFDCVNLCSADCFSSRAFNCLQLHCDCCFHIAVQVAESNFITPMVQQKLISIPPALIIIAQLLMAPLTGGWGLVLATPLMVILIVLVQNLYIKNQE